MKEKIDVKILRDEFSNRVREFYPYFLGFYLLSLVVSIFSKTWNSFFYWPAFHGSVIFFTILFFLTFKFNFRLNFKLNLGLEEKSLSWHIFIFKIVDLFKVNFKLNLSLKEKYLLWRVFILQTVRSVTALVKESFVILFSVISRLIRILFLFIKKKITTTTKSSWLKIIVVVILLLFALFKGIDVLDFLVLFYGLLSFLFILDSRFSAGLALACLVTCPILLIFKEDIIAETTAIYAYYFLIITVLTQIRELKLEKEVAVDNPI